MVDIIDLKAVRRERNRPLNSYFVRVDQYQDGVSGAVLDMGDRLEPDEMRRVAAHLLTLSRWLEDQAHEATKDDNDRLLAVTKVYASGRVWAYTDNAIQSSEQCEWLGEMFKEAVPKVG